MARDVHVLAEDLLYCVARREFRCRSGGGLPGWSLVAVRVTLSGAPTVSRWSIAAITASTLSFACGDAPRAITGPLDRDFSTGVGPRGLPCAKSHGRLGLSSSGRSRSWSARRAVSLACSGACSGQRLNQLPFNMSRAE